MAKQDSKPQGGAPEGSIVSKCKFDSCGKKPKKFGFCEEHYEMYMAGVIRGDGLKPTDYEAKLQNYQRKKKVA